MTRTIDRCAVIGLSDARPVWALGADRVKSVAAAARDDDRIKISRGICACNRINADTHRAASLRQSREAAHLQNQLAIRGGRGPSRAHECGQQSANPRSSHNRRSGSQDKSSDELAAGRVLGGRRKSFHSDSLRAGCQAANRILSKIHPFLSCKAGRQPKPAKPQRQQPDANSVFIASLRLKMPLKKLPWPKTILRDADRFRNLHYLCVTSVCNGRTKNGSNSFRA